MVIAADYPFLDIVGTMLVFFAWVVWFYLLFTVFTDLFRRHDISGWGKAGWMIFTIFLPFIGVFCYVIAQGKHMAERNMKHAQEAQGQMDAYVRSVAQSNGGATDQIAQAKELLDKGAIDQGEYERLKEKALT